MTALAAMYRRNAASFARLAQTLRQLALEDHNRDRRAKLEDDAQWYEDSAEMYEGLAAKHEAEHA